MIKLGVNVDHVATVRQARRESFPDPVEAAKAAVEAGADGITAHLREDRRHIQDQDIVRLKRELSVPLNLEMAAVPEIVKVALKVKPEWCCLVPERREELTTEGGLDLLNHLSSLKKVIGALRKGGLKVSVFIDADQEMVTLAKNLEADAVEIHTGVYARAWTMSHKDKASCSGTALALNNSSKVQLKKVVNAAQEARELGLLVNAGHGLDYDNVGHLAKAFPFNEFNIGFSIIAKSLMGGGD